MCLETNVSCLSLFRAHIHEPKEIYAEPCCLKPGMTTSDGPNGIQPADYRKLKSTVAMARSAIKDRGSTCCLCSAATG